MSYTTEWVTFCAHGHRAYERVHDIAPDEVTFAPCQTCSAPRRGWLLEPRNAALERPTGNTEDARVREAYNAINVAPTAEEAADALVAFRDVLVERGYIHAPDLRHDSA